MAYILRNINLELHIDGPLENYNYSRFDWTGKIVEVKFRGMPVAITERPDGQNEHELGKGFYNEFGMDTALGFEEAEVGGWFHKIGVGLLKKDDDPYLFTKTYEIRPADFELSLESNKVVIRCTSQKVNGYSYVLRKDIELHNSGFSITYHLENTGEKEINTDEYVHNFMALNNQIIGTDYILRLPFKIQPELFGASVNPEEKVCFQHREIKFIGTPEEVFFFSHLNGGEIVDAAWELEQYNSNLGIREFGSFKTDKVNLWGGKHVISPELFFNVSIKPGQSREWSRTYEIFNVS